MTACYCDYEPADAYWASRPIARKAHRCDECGGKIECGERYERVRAIWDGYPDTVKTCVYCLAMRDLVESRMECFCWAHHNLLEDLIETVRDSDDIHGLQMAVGRIMVERNHARSI